jgi:hypothetical protein
VVEGGDGPRFLLEPPQPLRVRPHLGRQDLDGDVPPEPRVPRPVHLAHPPRPDQLQDLVRPEAQTAGKWHVASLRV